ncbi:hypothetical protein D3C72_1265810 [compost metagenome]
MQGAAIELAVVVAVLEVQRIALARHHGQADLGEERFPARWHVVQVDHHRAHALPAAGDRRLVGGVVRHQEVEVRAALRPRRITQHLQALAVLHRHLHQGGDAGVEGGQPRRLGQAEEHALAGAVRAHDVLAGARIDQGR